MTVRRACTCLSKTINDLHRKRNIHSANHNTFEMPKALHC